MKTLSELNELYDQVRKIPVFRYKYLNESDAIQLYHLIDDKINLSNERNFHSVFINFHPTKSKFRLWLI